MFDHNETLALARVVAKEAAVLCGRDWFDACVHALDPAAQVNWGFVEGDRIDAGNTLCRITADASALLAAERSALNFLQMLSAVATEARRSSGAIEGLSPNPGGCVVLDKTKDVRAVDLSMRLDA
jgi:nicotinate-nucleotide pyrophosphorylase (carboxylating)